MTRRAAPERGDLLVLGRVDAALARSARARQRPDLLVVDDTNVRWEPGGTRERRMLAIVCHRPVYIVRAYESELEPTRAEFSLKAAFSVVVGVGSPTAATTLTVYRVVATADTCA
ncbi:MAG: hypothetical protein U0838_15580 [Chloroflexota bacterium]